MKRLILTCVLGAAFGAPLIAQTGPAARPAPAEVLQQLRASEGSVQRLELPPIAADSTAVTLRLGDRAAELVLRPHSIRAPGYRLLVETDEGELVPMLSSEPRTVRGVLRDTPGSHLAGSLTPAGLRGRLVVGGQLWEITPLHTLVNGATPGDHLVARIGNGGETDSRPAASFSGSFDVCEIAVDADAEFFQKKGSSIMNVEDDVENILNMVSDIFETDAAVEYSITAIIVRTSVANDPYSGLGINARVKEMLDHWAPTHCDIPRDTAQLFSGNTFDAFLGISIGKICKEESYTAVKPLTGESAAYRAAVSAHELGHQWNVQHCADDPGNAFDCAIMCPTKPDDCDGFTAFSQGSIDKLLTFKATLGCLNAQTFQPAPSINNASPSTVNVIGTDTLTVTGDHLLQASEVFVGNTSVPFIRKQVSSGGSAFTGALVCDVPTLTQLGTVRVTVVSACNGQSQFGLNVVEPGAPLLQIDGGDTLLHAGSSYTWELAGLAGHKASLLAADDDDTTSTIAGYQILDNPSVAWPPVDAGTLDASGYRAHHDQIPTGVASPIWTLHLQLVTFDPADGVTITGASAVQSYTIIDL